MAEVGVGADEEDMADDYVMAREHSVVEMHDVVVVLYWAEITLAHCITHRLTKVVCVSISFAFQIVQNLQI